MENWCRNMLSTNAPNNRNRGQNGGNSNVAWDIRELNNNTSRFDWDNSTNANTLFNTAATAASKSTTTTSSSTYPDASSSHAFGNWLCHHNHYQSPHQHHSLYTGDGWHLHPDPHLMCLNLGKRHYFEDISPGSDRHVAGLSIGKRGKPYYSDGHAGQSSAVAVLGSTMAATVPRCQVDGCHVPLVNAKDYHRRHKVCEIHSKAPKVIVVGLEQRFCQQCSRFHVVSEFDDTKRSCRRRLAGHNERRRKSSHDSISRTSSQDKLIVGRFPYLKSSKGRALSLLSSKADSWVSPPDLSSRSSAALRELIAEHRAAILARQLILERHHTMEELVESPSCSNLWIPHQHQILAEPQSLDRLPETGTHVTLELMQASSSEFGFLPARGKNRGEEEECSELWNTLEGAHVV